MSLDMPLMELYGMSESSGPHTLNLIDGGNWRVFSCGRVLNSVYIKIDQPDEEGNGEVRKGMEGERERERERERGGGVNY